MDKPENAGVARAVRESRERLRLNQAEYGRKIGVSVSAVSLWESGHVAPSAKNQRRIAEVEGITLAGWVARIERYQTESAA